MSRHAGFGIMLGLLTACGQQMDNQPKYETYEAAPPFPRQQAAQPLVPGTVPQSSDKERGSEDNPPPYSLALLTRGQERFNIFCTPCHSPLGDGDGMIVRRGFPQPPSFHSERLREAADSYFFGVISRGYGAMYSYAARVPPADRWAIVAYIRALQLSQHARVADLPEGVPESLREEGE